MGKIKLNKKGFTLIELLAVIVILAILILLAMPSVLSIMENARKNAFITEAQSFTKAANTKYAQDVLNDPNSETTCYSIKQLPVDKDLTDYTGSIQIVTDDGTGKVSYKIWLSNKEFSITGQDSADLDIEKLDGTPKESASESCSNS